VYYRVYGYGGLSDILATKTNPGTNLPVKRVCEVIYKAAGLPLIRIVRDKAEGAFLINSFSKEAANCRAGIVSLVFLVLCIADILTLRNIGDIWYTRVLAILISIFLPYYLFTLILDLIRDKINRQVPGLIDEFRGAFLKHERIKPALLECSKHTGGSLGKVVERAVLSTDVIKSLQELKANINNVWFGIFTQLLINYKTNGGELVDQLYKLNKTMVLYNNLEKKKSKRLLWYEIFAISVAFISIPMIFWFNTKILGNEGFVTSDMKANLIVSRIIGLSIFSLIVIRVLRKL
jgi:hypothetical protein